jgi:hypothetical protein
MQVEGASRDTVELLQATLRIAPEALDAIDMVRSARELVRPVLDPAVLTVADINESVVAARGRPSG